MSGVANSGEGLLLGPGRQDAALEKIDMSLSFPLSGSVRDPASSEHQLIRHGPLTPRFHRSAGWWLN